MHQRVETQYLVEHAALWIPGDLVRCLLLSADWHYTGVSLVAYWFYAHFGIENTHLVVSTTTRQLVAATHLLLALSFAYWAVR